MDSKDKMHQQSPSDGEYASALKGSNSQIWQTFNSSSARNPTGFYSYGGSGTSTITLGANADECYKCHQLGHWAKDCPLTNARVENNVIDAVDSGKNIPEKMCGCGAGPCLILTSTTEKNPGRKFYRCPAREDHARCRFFEWCDASAPTPTQKPFGGFGGQAGTLNSNDFSKSYDLATLCPCGAGPCRVFTARTEQNAGRQFLRCPIKQGDGSCGFFKWCDEFNSNNSSPISSHGFTSKHGSLPSDGAGRSRASSCFKCKGEGHWAKDCPSNI